MITFDWEIYLKRYPDLSSINSEIEAKDHFENHGKKEGRDGYFDESFYISFHDDLKNEKNPRDHYVLFGINEKRPASIASFYEWCRNKYHLLLREIGPQRFSEAVKLLYFAISKNQKETIKNSRLYADFSKLSLYHKGLFLTTQSRHYYFSQDRFPRRKNLDVFVNDEVFKTVLRSELGDPQIYLEDLREYIGKPYLVITICLSSIADHGSLDFGSIFAIDKNSKTTLLKSFTVIDSINSNIVIPFGEQSISALRVDFFEKPGSWILNEFKINGIEVAQLETLALEAFSHEKKYGLVDSVNRGILDANKNIHPENISKYALYLKNEAINFTENLIEKSVQPKISIIMPVYKPPLDFFEKAITSVVSQNYTNWELVIYDDCSPTNEHFSIINQFKQKYIKKIKFIKGSENVGIARATNSAVSESTGNYIVFLDQDDLLSLDCLTIFADSLIDNKNLELIYADEDKINELDVRYEPHFKPDFDYLYLLQLNYICHPLLVSRKLFDSVGGFSSGYDGAQDHEILLKFLNKINSSNVKHIPKILYHWRAHEDSTAKKSSAKNYASDAGISAVSNFLKLNNLSSLVNSSGELATFYDVKLLTQKQRKISFIIPTKDQYELLSACVRSIIKSDYDNYEIIIIDNRSEHPRTLKYLKNLTATGVAKVVDYDYEFNYSDINNLAAKYASGELLCFMNNDAELITKNIANEINALFDFSDIGVVGAKLLYPDKTIQHAGVVTGIGGIAGHAFKGFNHDDSGYFMRLKSRQFYSAVTAAFMLIRKDIFDAVGGFENKLKVAFNDIDLCLKVGEAGFRCAYTPYLELFHYESKSRGLEDTFEKQNRFRTEIDFMSMKWNSKLNNDPAYNRNLTLKHENFGLK